MKNNEYEIPPDRAIFGFGKHVVQLPATLSVDFDTLDEAPVKIAISSSAGSDFREVSLTRPEAQDVAGKINDFLTRPCRSSD